MTAIPVTTPRWWPCTCARGERDHLDRPPATRPGRKGRGDAHEQPGHQGHLRRYHCPIAARVSAASSRWIGSAQPPRRSCTRQRGTRHRPPRASTGDRGHPHAGQGHRAAGATRGRRVVFRPPRAAEDAPPRPPRRTTRPALAAYCWRRRDPPHRGHGPQPQPGRSAARRAMRHFLSRNWCANWSTAKKDRRRLYLPDRPLRRRRPSPVPCTNANGRRMRISGAPSFPGRDGISRTRGWRPAPRHAASVSRSTMMSISAAATGRRPSKARDIAGCSTRRHRRQSLGHLTQSTPARRSGVPRQLVFVA